MDDLIVCSDTHLSAIEERVLGCFGSGVLEIDRFVHYHRALASQLQHDGHQVLSRCLCHQLAFLGAPCEDDQV